MTRLGLACALFILGCRSPTPSPAIVAVGPSSSGRDAAVPASAKPRPFIAFLEKPGGVLQWDFEVHGLPATDPSTGAIVVADVSHGYIASSLALSIRWLRPGQKEPLRTLTVLDGKDASRVLYDIDSTEEAAETDKLAVSVRARTREVNSILAAAELGTTTACHLQSNEGGVGCGHPQRLACGALVAELRGDALAWRVGAETGTTKMGWGIAPMTIGDGPPKEMVTCVEEAHFDPVARSIAARIEQSCKGGGGDACFLPDEWRSVAVR